MTGESSNKQNRLAYSEIATLYAGTEPGEEDPLMRRKCREIFIGALKGKAILEIGSGPGVDANFLSQSGLQVTATDFCDEFVEIIKTRFPHIEARQMDMTKPNLEAGSFDGIYGFATFLHIPRSLAQHTLIGLRKLLKPTGVMFLTLIQSSNFKEYSVPDWGGKPNNPVHFTCYSDEEITGLLKSAGFRDVQLFHVPSPFYDNLPRLQEKGVTSYQVLATVCNA